MRLSTAITLTRDDEPLRQHIIGMVQLMGHLIVPAHLYDQAREALPEVADKIIKSERLPDTG